MQLDVFDESMAMLAFLVLCKSNHIFSIAPNFGQITITDFGSGGHPL
jgi:hypothetical protein